MDRASDSGRDTGTVMTWAKIWDERGETGARKDRADEKKVGIDSKGGVPPEVKITREQQLETVVKREASIWA